MRTLWVLYLSVFVFLPAMITGQVLPQVLKERQEVVFSFRINDRAELQTLTDIVSIDRVDGLTVTAYANIEQYLKFMKLGYDIELLPSPGLSDGIVMNDHPVLSPLTVWNYYPTYSGYESLMAQFQSNYPALCNLDTIGTLASGRRLLVLKISDNVNTDETEPEFFYSSSIHGDETTGYILMMHLADYLLTNYGTNAEATALVNSMEIFICPLANPDGTYYGGNNSVTYARRNNANNVDLNRNYPDPQNGPHPDGNAWQPETVAFMDFATQRHFAAGANFHGGVEVVNYPWDTWAALSADNSWWVFVSREYADTVHLHSPTGYMNYLNNGITNGYAWYEVNGGRQDYMNYYHHCREVTIEISDTKLLPASQLLAHWDYNWRSIILLMKQATYGIHGVITSQATGQPVVAKVFLVGHDNMTEVYSSSALGDYHRPLKAGTYTVEVTAPCFVTQVFQNVTVSDYSTLTMNIQMVPGAGVTTAAISGISGTTATSGGEVTCTGNSPVTARGVCWGTSINPGITGSHTVNGSGAGTFVSQITGLSPNTTYHVRAYATNDQGTVYGEDIQFSTACGTITLFPWNEGFENGGAIPPCWIQQQVNSSGINWTFITGSGNTHPATAHSGVYNACLKDSSPADNKTRLISPPMNLSGLPSPQLKFWHTQALWSPDQDQLAVYYRTSASGTWMHITTYTNNITTWTQETLALPNPSADYYIAFEGNAKYGYGVCVDDVQVSSSCAVLYPVSVTIGPSANPVFAGESVTITATPVNGGATPAYQWYLNGLAVGTNSNTYTYIPDDQDQVWCRLTSGLSCAAGNPAWSDTVTMTVSAVPLTREVQNIVAAGGQSLCYDALQTISVAGSGTLFEVLPGGSTTFVAGENILFYPGTTVHEGGYLLGYIASSGPFCQGGAKGPSELTPEPGSAVVNGSWKVIPNPAGDFITLAGNEGSGKCTLEIFSMNGEIHYSSTFAGKPGVIPVKALRPGMYVVRINESTGTHLIRFVKL